MAVSNILSVRVSPRERQVLETAAAQQNSKLSDFVRRMAVEAAEQEIMDRRIVEVSAEQWDEFESWAASPAEPLPAVAEILTQQPVWAR